MVYARTRPTPPDAATVDGIDSSDFLQASGTATTSEAISTGTGYQASTTRDALVFISGNINLTPAQSAVAQLCVDSASTPTTVRAQASCNDAPAAGSVNHPFFFAYKVPAGHYYSVNRSSGSGTVTLPYVTVILL